MASLDAVSCPVCRSADVAEIGPPIYRQPTHVAGAPIDLSDLQLRWHQCRACQYLFIHPPIPEARLLACYAAAPAGHWETDKRIVPLRFYDAKKRLLEKVSPGKRVLDFGCFDGGFLAYLGPAYEKFGIEPAAEPARIAEQRGVNVLGPTVAAAIEMATATALPPMDAIVAFDVFEHLNDPVTTLRELRRLLKPGGVILIETGDTDAPAFKRVGIRYGYAALVEHVGLFNRSSIEEAGRQAGLTLVHFERSLHHVTAWPARITYELRNGVWHLLRAIDRLGLPLPARLKEVARGHLPRMTKPDHFLAVLRVNE